MSEKINYQLKTDEVISKVSEQPNKPTLLLHACCAPCATYVLEYLSRYFDITLFFCNPNITDTAEYEKRLSELKKLCETADFARNIEIVEDNLSSEDFFEYVKGFENEPEGGARCTRCFNLRLLRTAEYAKRENFDYFTTTLTISPHKNADLINRIGSHLSEEHGVAFLPSDFKKRGGYQRSIVLCREYNIYRQHYCGCEFSKTEE